MVQEYSFLVFIYELYFVIEYTKYIRIHSKLYAMHRNFNGGCELLGRLCALGARPARLAEEAEQDLQKIGIG